MQQKAHGATRIGMRWFTRAHCWSTEVAYNLVQLQKPQHVKQTTQWIASPRLAGLPQHGSSFQNSKNHPPLSFQSQAQNSTNSFHPLIFNKIYPRVLL